MQVLNSKDKHYEDEGFDMKFVTLKRIVYDFNLKKIHVNVLENHSNDDEQQFFKSKVH